MEKNYKELYERVLERAKCLIQNEETNVPVFYVDNITELFPELKGSDGERIRKHLITFFKDEYGENSNALFAGVEAKDILAWLEKQGENKDILEDAVLDSNEDGLIADTIKYKNEQKPAWSEEDRDLIEEIISHYRHLIAIESLDSERYKSYIIPKLKSLKLQNRWKPSDEQMTALRRMKAAIAGEGEIYEPLNSLYEDLKKLRGE